MTKPLSLPEFLPYRLNNLGEKISVSLSRIYVERFGISISQWRILATLAEHGELQAKQIGLQTNMDKVRVSRAIASLHARKLLHKRSCARDNRASNITLNAAGRRLYDQIVPQALAWEKQLIQPLSRPEQQALFAILDKLELRLDEISASANT